VVVGDSVVDGSALTPGAHQTGEAQLSKLVAGSGLRGVHRGGQVPNAQLARLEEGVDHSQPPGVGQQLEALSELDRGLDRKEVILGLGDGVGMDWLVHGSSSHDFSLSHLNIDSSFHA
jgi:hypothetical protein